SRKWIKKEKADLYNSLSKIKDLKVIPSTANYHLLKIAKKGMDAFNLRDILINEGILIRVPTGFYPLIRDYFRLAVLDDKSNTALLKALNLIF
ncbi:MAG: L-threonine-O-3-phosphate decarboxylase, partial [Firmicutes bacterium]|nr:L-threonine-O-3-phosphate decarboxylase [Bacillota bacterium]